MQQDVTVAVEGIDVVQFALGLIDDLDKLRSGEISIPDAQARANLARQVMRAVGYVVQARLMLSSRAVLIDHSTE